MRTIIAATSAFSALLVCPVAADAASYIFTDLSSGTPAFSVERGVTLAYLTNSGSVYYNAAGSADAYEFHMGTRTRIGGAGDLLGATDGGLLLRGGSLVLAPNASDPAAISRTTGNAFTALNNNLDLVYNGTDYFTEGRDQFGRLRNIITPVHPDEPGARVTHLADNGYGAGYLGSGRGYFTSRFEPGSLTERRDERAAFDVITYTNALGFENLTGVNSSETITGTYYVTDSTSNGGIGLRAFIGRNGTLTDLGALGAGLTDNGFSYGFDINDAGAVVGMSDYGNFRGAKHAFLWQDGKLTDLNNLIDPSLGVTLTSAFQINNNGQILALFNNGRDGLETLALLTPTAVPEPATWAMMILGFGMVGATARRQTSNKAVAM